MEWNRGLAGVAIALAAAFTQAGCAEVGQREAGTIGGVVDTAWNRSTLPLRDHAARGIDRSCCRR